MRFEEKTRKYLAYIFIPNTSMGFLTNALIAGLFAVTTVYLAFQGTLGFLCLIGMLVCFTIYWRVLYKKLFGKEKSSVDIKGALWYSVVFVSGAGLVGIGSLWIQLYKNSNALGLTMLIVITMVTIFCIILGIHGLNRTDKKISKEEVEK